MGNGQKHTGGCHCGKVRYEVEVDLNGPVYACNCSMCGRAGTLLSFVPSERFTLLSGQEDLKDYQFHRHVIHHFFCTTCGIKPFAGGVGKDGAETRAINVRCLDGVDLDGLSVTQFDGKAM